MEKAEAKVKRGTSARPTVRVVTAGEISAKLRADTVAKLQGLVAPDVQVEFEVDPALIGGMVVHLPDRTIDMSMAGKFRSYGRAVQELIGNQIAVLESWARSEDASGKGAPGLTVGKE